MASPGRSPLAHAGEYGAANVQLQVRFESSSEDDDDEDEHKLHIDLGSAAEEDPPPRPCASALGDREGGGAAATTGPVASGGPPPAAPEAQISSLAEASGSAKGTSLQQRQQQPRSSRFGCYIWLIHSGYMYSPLGFLTCGRKVYYITRSA